MRIPESKLLQYKIWGAVKKVGLLYIIPVFAAAIICFVCLPFASKTTSGFIVTLLTGLGFSILSFLPVLIFYQTFYKKITLGIETHYGNKMFIIVNGGFTQDRGIFAALLTTYVDEVVANVIKAFRDIGYFVNTEKPLYKAINNVVVVFVADISEDDFYKRWGIKYKQINGLCYGSYILIVFKDTLEKSALEHELRHIIVDELGDELTKAGKYMEAKYKLGLE